MEGAGAVPGLDARPSRAWRALLRPGFTTFVFVTFTGAFYRYGLSAPAQTVVYAGGTALMALDARRLLDRPAALALGLAYPALCLVSALWSIDPAATLQHAVQYLFTALIGIWIGTVLALRTVFVVLTAALALCVAASVANLVLGFSDPYMQNDYVGAERFFLGIYTQKNVMGAVIALAALGLVVLGTGAGRRGLLLIAAACALVPLMLATGSTTATGLLLVVLTMPGVWWVLNLAVPRRVTIAALSSVIALAAFAVVLHGASPVGAALELAGKEADLSGRTLIWQAASTRFADAPWLGTGYQAFWTATEYRADVEMVRATVLDTIANFHQAWLEVLVGTGLVGLAMLGLPVAVLIGAALLGVGRGGSALDVGCLYLILLVLARSTVEAGLYYQHQLDYLVVAVLCAALLPERERAVSRTLAGRQVAPRAGLRPDPDRRARSTRTA